MADMMSSGGGVPSAGEIKAAGRQPEDQALAEELKARMESAENRANQLRGDLAEAERVVSICAAGLKAFEEQNVPF